MSSEESIFDEALRKPSTAARAAYLDQACGMDARLRREVEALLISHERATGFLESPPTGVGPRDVQPTVAPDQTPPPMHTVGSVVGPYKLLQQIGEGGMGVVFMAEQLRPVRRRVALKIIKPGLDTRQLNAR